MKSNIPEKPKAGRKSFVPAATAQKQGNKIILQENYLVE